MLLPRIRSMQDLEALVLEIGALPLFRNPVEGFSVEEAVLPELWFAEGVDGPWEWKGPIAQGKKCVYGKFFHNKTGFVSAEWFPAFANYRRRGYDFEGRCDEGLASRKEMKLMELLDGAVSLNTKELKRLGGYGKGGNTGFETVIAGLQMQTYLVVEDFEYARTAKGEPYGWGVARYTTPERWVEGFDESLYEEEPEDSFRRLTGQLARALKQADADRLAGLIRTRA